ncbi:hypothetical protein E5288_WYG012813 [Bos mutus]|uniref:Uncharacterized protein n=1 Tax=Bos mutus TaxID=72004 RepID=A0A6B0QWK2_9CETA|nr:hypothetical protein [Bos mutus]
MVLTYECQVLSVKPRAEDVPPPSLSVRDGELLHPSQLPSFTDRANPQLLGFQKLEHKTALHPNSTGFLVVDSQVEISLVDPALKERCHRSGRQQVEQVELSGRRASDSVREDSDNCTLIAGMGDRPNAALRQRCCPASEPNRTLYVLHKEKKVMALSSSQIIEAKILNFFRCSYFYHIFYLNSHKALSIHSQSNCEWIIGALTSIALVRLVDKIRTEGTGEDEDMRRKSSLENVPSNIGEGRENTRLPFTGSPWYIYTRVMSSKIFNTAEIIVLGSGTRMLVCSTDDLNDSICECIPRLVQPAREHPVYLEHRWASSERSDPVCRAHGSQRPDNFGLSGLPVLLWPLSTIFLEVAAEFNLWISFRYDEQRQVYIGGGYAYYMLQTDISTRFNCASCSQEKADSSLVSVYVFLETSKILTCSQTFDVVHSHQPSEEYNLDVKEMHDRSAVLVLSCHTDLTLQIFGGTIFIDGILLHPVPHVVMAAGQSQMVERNEKSGSGVVKSYDVWSQAEGRVHGCSLSLDLIRTRLSFLLEGVLGWCLILRTVLRELVISAEGYLRKVPEWLQADRPFVKRFLYSGTVIVGKRVGAPQASSSQPIQSPWCTYVRGKSTAVWTDDVTCSSHFRKIFGKSFIESKPCYKKTSAFSHIKFLEVKMLAVKNYRKYETYLWIAAKLEFGFKICIIKRV